MLNKSSSPRKRGSKLRIYMDSRFRGNDEPQRCPKRPVSPAKYAAQLLAWFLTLALTFAAYGAITATLPDGTLLSSNTVQTIGVSDATTWLIDAAAKTDSPARAQIAANLAADAGIAKCDVEIRQIFYTTSGPRGEATNASGAILLPRQPAGASTCPTGPQPLLAYTPGTEMHKERVLANKDAPETGILGGLYAAQGYVVVMTDNLGLGLSSFPYHPYLHSDTEARALIDVVRAAKTVLSAEGMTTSKMFVMGYSQGGHSAMAASRALETQYASEFPNFTASAPLSGPYALETNFLVDVERNASETVKNGLYALIGWQKTYGNLYRQPTDIFKSPFASAAENYFPIDDQAPPTMPVPATPSDLLTSSFRTSFLTDPRNTARIAARTNSFVGSEAIGSAVSPIDPNTAWSPNKPMMLCGASGDTIVNFAVNAQAAFDVFATQLHKPVSIRDFQPELDAVEVPASLLHGAAIPLCMRAARNYFEGFSPFTFP